MEPIKEELKQFILKERYHPRQIGWKEYKNLLSYDSELYRDNLPPDQISPYFTGAKYKTLLWDAAHARFPHFSISAELLNTVDFAYGSTYRKSIFHNHDYFEFIYVFSGSCVNVIGGKKTTMAEGDIALLNLQEIHQIGILDDESVIFNLLVQKEVFDNPSSLCHRLKKEFSQFFLNSIYQNTDACYLLLPAAGGGKAQLYLELLIQEYFRENDAALGEAPMLLDLFLSRFFQELKNTLPALPKHPASISPADLMTFIQGSFATLSLDELASHYGYSRRSMQRCLKKFFNASFSGLIQECRLKEIRRLLEETTYTLPEIAEMAGLNNRTYMDRLFKKAFGMTAAQYRKKHAKAKKVHS